MLAPLYFHHRYQLEAAAKSIGGLEYAYAVRGDGQGPARPVPAARQRAALEAVLGALDPSVLDLPEPLLGMLMPPSVAAPPHHEPFDSETKPVFDALGAAGTAADLALAALLPPERLARLVDFHRRDSSFPGVEELLAALRRRAFDAPAPSATRLKEIRRTVQAATVRRLLMAAAAPAQTSAVRAALEAALRRLRSDLVRVAGEPADQPLRALLAQDIERFLSRPTAAALAPSGPPDPPPGPPIGGWSAADECEWMPHP